MLVDFFLQSKTMVEAKQKNAWKSWALLGHSILAGALAYLFTAIWLAHWILWITVISHWLIDLWKNSRQNPEQVHYFWADQFLHILVIIGLTIWMADADHVKSVFNEFPLRETGIMMTGLLFVLHPCSIIVKKVMGRWELPTAAKTEENGDLEKAGHAIGLLERFLIFVFILINQFAAIGLLIAAKSILRFGSVKDKERKESEYILVGTLLSFSLATFTGLVVMMFV